MDEKTPTVFCKAVDAKITMSRCLMQSQEALTFWGADAAKYTKGCPCPKREEALMARRYCEDCGRPIYSGKICGACKKAEKEKAIEGEDMANKKRTCTNCERPDLNIANAKGHCHTCHEAGKGLEGEGLAAALLEAKKRVNDPENRRMGKKIKNLRDVPMAKVEAEAKIIKETFKQVDQVISTGLDAVSSLAMTAAEVVNTKAQKLPADDQPQPAALVILGFRDEADFYILQFLQDEARRCRRTLDQQAMWMLQSHLPESRGQGRVIEP